MCLCKLWLSPPTPPSTTMRKASSLCCCCIRTGNQSSQSHSVRFHTSVCKMPSSSLRCQTRRPQSKKGAIACFLPSGLVVEHNSRQFLYFRSGGSGRVRVFRGNSQSFWLFNFFDVHFLVVLLVLLGWCRWMRTGFFVVILVVSGSSISWMCDVSDVSHVCDVGCSSCYFFYFLAMQLLRCACAVVRCECCVM